MLPLKAGRRYAGALFFLALAEGVHERVYQDLKGVCQLLDQSRRFRMFLHSPNVSLAEKKKVVAQVLGEGVSSRFLEFLEFLIERRRADILPAVLVQYHRLANDYAGIIEVDVTSAMSLTDGEREELRARLAARTQRTVVLREHLETGVLGGVMVRYGDHVVDGTITTYLAYLRQHLRALKIV